MSQEVINCPFCGSKTKYGSLEISGSIIGFLLLGLNQQDLHFKAFDEKYQEFSTQKETVIKESENVYAFKCEKCNAISFKPANIICRPKNKCCGG